MKLTVIVPEVESCAVTRCGYNVGGDCRAKAITVGDITEPHCDTFFDSGPHTKVQGQAGVGACKMRSCRHNRDLECEAEAIQVETRGGQAECATYAP